MRPIFLTMPGDEVFGTHLCSFLKCDTVELDIHRFPDGESCPRLKGPVAGRDLVIVCMLDQPNDKLVDLYLTACTARELGAKSVGFVIPYLPYMRQDKRFKEGEGITSSHFARLISSCCDWLVTVDPHLHRHHDLSEIYSVPTRVVHAAPEIAKWISSNVKAPVIIGPDGESEQWVMEVARLAGCPYTVLQKTRTGDLAVEVTRLAGIVREGMTGIG